MTFKIWNIFTLKNIDIFIEIIFIYVRRILILVVFFSCMYFVDTLFLYAP